MSSKTAGGILSVDFRGKHGHHFHLDENIKKSVKEHIETIPRIESHYCRQGNLLMVQRPNYTETMYVIVKKRICLSQII